MFAERTQWNLAPNRVSQTLSRLRGEGRKILDLTTSNPTECFKYDGGAVLKAFINPGSLKYHPDPRGLTVARQAVVDYYAARGVKVSLEDLLLTTSTSEAYTFAFRLLSNPGDEILAPSPSYPLFDFLAEIQDVKLAGYPLRYDHGWHIDLPALEQSITPRTRGIVIVHPNNPTGHYVKAQELARLNEICAARGLAIIADEVFLDFSLRENQPRSLLENQSILTLTMSGLSKISGLPQMKVAWLCLSGPEQAKRDAMARLEMIADTYLSMSTPAQLALPALLAQRHGFQQQLMARVRNNLDELDRQLREQSHCSRLEVEGGWYAIVRIPATRSDEDLAIALLEERGVYIHPGHFYDLPEGYIVVSLITPERDFALGIEQVLAAV
ncbi:MAG TPA: pyridoxal phosphate-dependent aminotransferase [Terriglobales bacterium]|nr:pyridoxal phosphate-dependent aminotransferase [Terriglobales bacterium]